MGLALLNQGRWNAAYYLMGYAVECSLKACIVNYVSQHLEVIFSERNFFRDCWTHDFEMLLKISQLDGVLNNAIQFDAQLGQNWGTATQWEEISRYRLSKNQVEAMELFNAITDPQHGVLPWIKQHW